MNEARTSNCVSGHFANSSLIFGRHMVVQIAKSRDVPMNQLMPSILIFLFTLVFGTTSAATIEDYTRLPERENVSISPDGNKVVFQQNTDGKRVAVLFDIENREMLKAFDLQQLKAQAPYFLTNNNVIFRVSEVTRVVGTRSYDYSMAHNYDIKADKLRTTLVLGEGIWKGQTGLGRVIGVSADEEYAYMPAFTDSGSIVDSKPEYSVLRVSLNRKTKPIPIFTGTRYTDDFIVDKKGQVLALEVMHNERNEYVIKGLQGKKLETIYKEEAERPPLAMRGVNEARTHIYVSGRQENEEFRLIELMSLEDGSRSDAGLSRDNKEVERVYSDHNRVVYGVRYSGFRPSYYFFDQELNARVASILEQFQGESVWIVSLSEDKKSIVALLKGSQHAGDYILFRKDQSPFFIGEQRPNIKPEDIHPQATWGFKASDGFRVPVLLTIPAEKVANLEPMPTVVMPHGGPASYDRLGFEWKAQLLADQGYLVVQPQFRGSTGFGTQHYLAGHGEWGKKSQSDITESVEKLTAQGYVDSERVCIMGWSYGGYAALAGGAFTPELYDCVVSINGVTDLREMLEQERKDHGKNSWTVNYWENQIAGDEKPTKDYLGEISPAQHADQFTAPVLLIHGGDDRVVRKEQSEKMAAALRDHRKPVDYIEFEDESHQLHQQGSREKMMEKVLPFLKEHLQ